MNIETQRPMKLLIRDVLRGRHGRKDFVEHPSVTEIYRRLPEDLLEWFERIVIIERDPLTIHCSPIEKSDRGYFEIWRYIRDKSEADFHPPESSSDDGSSKTSTTDGGDRVRFGR